jgi:hypothetical protein
MGFRVYTCRIEVNAGQNHLFVEPERQAGQMKKGSENLVFDYHTIRLLIGLIALFFPWVVSIRAAKITPSISWSYYTDARDLFVGLLFVIGAFLISYKGHKPILKKNKVGKFWSWVSRFWKGAVHFRIWEKEHEEDLVAWMGGVAAWVTAVNPTAFCVEKICPPDPTSTLHYIGAFILFSTTVYFCLVAFRGQAKAKIKNDQSSSSKSENDPKKLRIRFYSFCGWGIGAIMLASVVAAYTPFGAMLNITFWSEAAALELFGIAWLVASHYLPFFTDEKERQKLF